MRATASDCERVRASAPLSVSVEVSVAAAMMSEVNTKKWRLVLKTVVFVVAFAGRDVTNVYFELVPKTNGNLNSGTGQQAKVKRRSLKGVHFIDLPALLT